MFGHGEMKTNKNTKSDKILLTLREAAALLGMSEWTLRRDVIDRRLACVRRRGRLRGKIMIMRGDLDSYLRRNRVAAVGE